MSESGEGTIFSSLMSGSSKLAGKVGSKVANSEITKAAKDGAVKGATDGAQKGITDHFANKYGMSRSNSKPEETKTLGTIEQNITDEKETKEAVFTPEPKSTSKLPNINIPKPHFKRKTGGGRVKSHPQIEEHRRKMREKKTAVIRTETKSISQEWAVDVWCVANFSYKGELPCDLEFMKGDKIKVLLRTDTDFDWWEGEAYGKTGIFPANYVSIMNK
ncbi:SH3 domain-containing protein [Oopsacas minuta]|uniref:SH3 domain-containing YSC84-like protein 1 n=1 Tax=Oopsacas minuta TaxID=111878 RepID=A0AAV7KCT8_9METZ|nr:SH3 domain-containing protein [Oopsacas minuta]